MFRCLALVVFPALALACCPPKLWEATEFIAIGSTSKDGSPHYTEIEQNVTVDRAMGRTYIQQALTSDGHSMMQKILQDYRSKDQFVTNMMTGACERTPLEDMEPGCIPDNATKIIQSYMGAGAHKVMATMYKYMVDKHSIYVTIADDGCIPLAYEASGPTKDGGGYTMSVEIVGVTAGIKSTALLATPSKCPMKGPIFTGVGK